MKPSINSSSTVDTDLDYVKAHTRYLTRAQEWQREQQRSDLLLFGQEIDYAEAWLMKADDYAKQSRPDKIDVVNPLAQDIQREYISISRQEDTRRKRLARSAQFFDCHISDCSDWWCNHWVYSPQCFEYTGR